MKKEFELSAKLNTSDFDRSIEQMVKKLNDVSKPIGAMQQQTAGRMQQQGMGGMSAPSMEAYQKATQSARREMDSLISETAKGQEKLGKFIAQRTESIKKLIQEQKSLVKDSQEELAIREKITKAEANQQQLKEQYRQRDQQLNQALDAKEAMKPGGWQRLGTAYQNGGVGGAAKAAGRMASQNPLGAIGGAIGGIGAVAAVAGSALEMGGQAYEQVARSPFRSQINRGSAVEKTITSSMDDMNSIYGQAWTKERSKAMGQAKEQVDISKDLDKNRLTSGVLKIGGGIMAMIASAVGTIATGGLGSLVTGGLAVGGAMTTGSGISDLFGNERRRSLTYSNMSSGIGGAINDTAIGKMSGAGDWFNKISSQQMEEYNSNLANETGDRFQQSLKSKEQSSPLKRLAAQNYSSNAMRDLGFQRSAGLDYESMHGHGGFNEQMINAGFLGEMGQQVSGQILGAGGSTSMAGQMGSKSALQYQRGMNMTNMGAISGTLSSQLGNVGSTEEATIKILAEGQKRGLDSSRFAEENRKFSQELATIVSKSGASTGDDFQRISDTFGKFLGSNTTKGIEGAKGAYEEFQQRSGTMSGATGVMQTAAINSNKNLAGLGAADRQVFGQMSLEDMNEGNPAAVSLANKAKMSVADLAKEKETITQGTSSRFGQYDKARKILKDAGITSNQLLGEERKNLTPGQEAAAQEMTSLRALEHPGESIEKQKSALSYELGGKLTLGQEESEGKVSKLRDSKETGKLEDKTVGSLAEASRLGVDSLQKFSGELIPTLKTINEFNENMKKANELTAKSAKLMEAMNTMLGTKSTQQQLGKPPTDQ